MSLQIGTKLGPYEILAPLGAGGMGEVWRARDTRLGRDVAVKVLPEALATDPERLARFQREAQVLAVLNHSHIGSIYGLEDADGTKALVLEYVEGPTLADRLTAAPLPVDEAMELARQVAEALEAAHDKGIIHRDLKPANIKITPNGMVKVLDFGLARAVSDDAGSAVSRTDSPTITAEYTRPGVVLGTAPYMSPEQARGRPVDKRSDIWSFGVVFYECLTGRMLYGGETTSDSIAAILQTEPDWSLLPPSTPPTVQTLLRRCLTKDRNKRLRDVGDARIEIESVLADPSAQGPTRPPASNSQSSLAARIAPWILTAALGAIVLGTFLGRGPSDGASEPIRLSARLPEDIRLSAGNFSQFSILAIAPDGSRIAFAGNQGGDQAIYVRSLDQFPLVRLKGTEGGWAPFFSPDGQWIGFFAAGKLRRVAVTGGLSIDICPVGNHRGGAWGPDGTIVFSPTVSSPLMRVPAEGGTPTELTHLDPARNDRTHRWPVFLPGGEEVAFTVGVRDKPGNYDDASIEAVSLRTGRRRPLLLGASRVRVGPGDLLLLGRADQVFALPLAAATGQPARLVNPILTDVLGEPGSGEVCFDVSRSGTLVYAEKDPHEAEFEMAWISQDGKVEPLALPRQLYSIPRISPDGKRIAVNVGPGGGGDSDVWIHDLAAGGFTRLTFDSRSSDPLWLPGGRHIAYSSVSGKGFYVKPADGSTEAELLVPLKSEGRTSPMAITPDSQLLIFEREDGPRTSADLFYWRRKDGEIQPLVQTEAFEQCAELSPDGKWLAYYSDEAGKPQVFVQAFPERKGRWQISMDGGRSVYWSRDGKEIFFEDGTWLLSVPVATEPTFTHGPPRRIMKLDFEPGYEGLRNYDVGADGRFLVIRRPSGGTNRDHLNLILNFADTSKPAESGASK